MLTKEITIEIANTVGGRSNCNETFLVCIRLKVLSVRLFFFACNQINASNNPVIVRTNAYIIKII